jgi:N-acetylmuramoyl-L-alanine amidase
MKNMIKIFTYGLAFASFLRADQHVVIIDAGHGGSKDSGAQSSRTYSAANNATSPSGLREKDLTLELSLEIKKQLQALAKEMSGVRVDGIMTRVDDQNPDFGKRANICAATEITPTAIISIHFNASNRHDALGTLAVVHNKNVNQNHERDMEFAIGLTQAVHAATISFLPSSKPRAPISDAHLHNGAGSNFFFQLSRHPNLKTVPKCFLEVEFIDRTDVDQKLLQKRKETFPVIARAIAKFV